MTAGPAGAGFPSPVPGMDGVALYDFLSCASLALLAAEGRETAKAETALLEASIACAGAFPPGSPESRALGVILTAVERYRGAVEAADASTGLDLGERAP